MEGRPSRSQKVLGSRFNVQLFHPFSPLSMNIIRHKSMTCKAYEREKNRNCSCSTGPGYFTVFTTGVQIADVLDKYFK